MGLLDETLILFTSDHGEYLGDHRTGSKVYFHEPSAHISVLLRMPKSWSNRCHGTYVNTPVTHADILPTLVKVAGGKVPEDVDGIDLIALARGELDTSRYIIATCGRLEPDKFEYIGITDGVWKYIWYPEDSHEQLFNLSDDPMEYKNLAFSKEYKDKCKELHSKIVDMIRSRYSGLIEDNKLISRPVLNISTRDLRNQTWPGYHTEFFTADVRH